MAIWVATNYENRGEGRTPSTWRLDFGGGFYVVVTRYRPADSKAWFLLCPELRITEWQQLLAEDIDVAKQEALIFVAEKLQKMNQQVVDFLK